MDLNGSGWTVQTLRSRLDGADSMDGSGSLKDSLEDYLEARRKQDGIPNERNQAEHRDKVLHRQRRILSDRTNTKLTRKIHTVSKR